MEPLSQNQPFQPDKTKSIKDLRILLEDDLDQLTDDELLNAPLSLVEAMLDRYGVPRRNFNEQTLLTCAQKAGTLRLEAGEAPLPSPAAQLLPPKPLGLALDLLAALREHRRISFHGPGGTGKSQFLQAAFLTDPKVREEFPRVVHIDCAALRMESIWHFEREAVWAQFGCEDEAFRSFLNGLSVPFGIGSLDALIESRLRDGGLIVLDDADRLDQSGEIHAWLDGHLLPLAERLGAAVLLCERAPALARSLRHDIQLLEFPQLGLDDLDAWLFQPALRSHLALGPGKSPALTAAAVLELTGGAPSLLRDLGNYLVTTKLHGLKALHAFARWRLEIGYMADCDRFVRAARHSHALMSLALAERKAPLNLDVLTPKQRRELLLTGAVRLNAEGKLAFTSRLYALRLRELLKPENFSLGLLRSNLHELLQDGDLHKLKNCAELAGDALAKFIAREKRPKEGLLQFLSLLVRWGFEPTLWLRDPGNARLWAPFLSPEKLGPFSASQQPHFARAAQTGRIVTDEMKRVYLPLTGNSGIVEAVLTGRFLKRDVAAAHEPIEIDRLAGLVRAIRPTLSQVLERLALRQERKFQEHLIRKAEVGGGTLNEHVLRESGCQSLALLQKLDGRWFVARFERTRLFKDSLDRLLLGRADEREPAERDRHASVAPRSRPVGSGSLGGISAPERLRRHALPPSPAQGGGKGQRRRRAGRRGGAHLAGRLPVRRRHRGAGRTDAVAALGGSAEHAVGGFLTGGAPGRTDRPGYRVRSVRAAAGQRPAVITPVNLPVASSPAKVSPTL